MRSNKGLIGKVAIVVVFAFAVVSLTNDVSAQNEQMERFKQRREQAIKAASDREKGVTNADKSAAKLPVINVDVQMVLTRLEYPNFVAAKPNPAAKILDGESLWMYVKFNGKLANYVGEPENGEDGNPRYRLYAEIGPKGDITALNRYVLVFREEDLTLTELKINLSPGLKGRNASMPLVLDRAGASNPGVWQNEIRLSNTTAEPRPITMNLASSPVTFELTKGATGYKKIQSAYDNVLVYGTVAAGAKPAAGKFESDRVRQEVKTELKTRSQDLINLHFVSDDWMETFASTPQRSRSRSVLALISFSNEGKCYEGVARIRESFDEPTGKFGPTFTDVKDAKTVPCTTSN
jgi:hypothetical protein